MTTVSLVGYGMWLHYGRCDEETYEAIEQDEEDVWDHLAYVAATGATVEQSALYIDGELVCPSHEIATKYRLTIHPPKNIVFDDDKGIIDKLLIAREFHKGTWQQFSIDAFDPSLLRFEIHQYVLPDESSDQFLTMSYEGEHEDDEPEDMMGKSLEHDWMTND